MIVAVQRLKDRKILQQLIFRRAEHNDLSSILKLLCEDALGKARESLSKFSKQCYEEVFQKIAADLNHALMVVELENKIIATCPLILLPSLTFQGSSRLQVEALRRRGLFFMSTRGFSVY